MQFPVNGPILFVSQLSPKSITLFPHFAFSVQEEVSSWQLMHFKVPPLKVLKFVHELIAPNKVPSQASPMFRILFPHAPCTPWHFEVSSLHKLQEMFPSVNVDGL